MRRFRRAEQRVGEHRTLAGQRNLPYAFFSGDVAASPLSGNPMQALLTFPWSGQWMG